MIADIATGNTAAADICFLVALVLFAVAGLVMFRPAGAPEQRLIPGYLGLAAVALGLLLW